VFQQQVSILPSFHFITFWGLNLENTSEKVGAGLVLFILTELGMFDLVACNTKMVRLLTCRAKLLFLASWAVRPPSAL
jgi:hypothetical protein